MDTTKKTDKTKKVAVLTAKSEVETKARKLSPVGEWMRKHPHGLEGFVINDQSVLYN